MSEPSFKLSIMITTLNRVEELERTLPILEALVPAPSEIWVVADGCSDGTVEYVTTAHPAIHLIVHERSMGSVASRVDVMERVSGDLVLALDDDSYPEQRDCVARLTSLFAEHPRLAIAAFPQRSNEYPETLTQENFGLLRPVRNFPNSGACLRVSTYRRLPGFETMFFHAYEEPDYAIQCVANDWEIQLYPEITIRHHWTPNQRSEIRTHHRHARNELWSALMRCPFPQAFGLIAYRILSQARYAASRGSGWLLREPLWWFAALRGIPQAMRRRQPITWQGYKRWLALPDD